MTRLTTTRPPTHPGEMLFKEFIEPRGLSLAAFARAIGVSVTRVHDIVGGKCPITIDTALRLERVLTKPAEFWMGLQLDRDLWHAQRSPEGAKIQALAPLPPPSSSKPLVQPGAVAVETGAGRSTPRLVITGAGKRQPTTLGGSVGRKRTIKQEQRKGARMRAAAKGK